ncbi:uncharacterized protein B0J16DRAFT_393790 [Fusarium flagelliforme]|uniref:uncharacterized protein n=1 Tax=Fusarium flagelliforme TaxID=2675880 RepID=UPI001E8E12FF|nr:uncharacterized protein B0J16DRAFT_393790 [Fusarium flagelliforme]KAH7191777.1 hypothetical protein B0J16DRAFT_393790 [Fusarium flagelliforme]
MEYDLEEGSTPLNAGEVFREIKELYDMNMYRGKSEAWAFKDIKFLVYDDTADFKRPKQPQQPQASRACDYDSNDEESMLQYALELSRQTDDTDSVQPAVGHGKEPEHEPGSTNESAESSPQPLPRIIYQDKGFWDPKSDENVSCHICSFLPELPQNPKPRKLRLFSPKDMIPLERFMKLDSCRHYVSVSYCWPSRAKDENGNPIAVKGTYQIREPDGTVRASRASDDVIDRAIDFAQSCGLRLIWIDQECLPQEDNEEREISLQAMDIVYSRSIITAGLHSTIISNPCQPRSIEQLIKVFKSLKKGSLTWDNISNPSLAAVIPLTLDFIDNVRKEKWYTRAWIAQEAVSSSGKNALVFRLSPGMTMGQRNRFSESSGRPAHSLDKGPRFQSTQWSILADDFMCLVEGIAEFYRVRRDAGGSSTLLALKPHAVTLLDAAATLWPSTQKGVPYTYFFVGGASYGFRKRLNAAGALSIFRHRHCTRPHDRLAIMANLCGYDIRLDTRRVRDRGGSLRVALLALATLNSDLSLFVPELYNPVQTNGLPSKISMSQGPNSEIGLIQPFDRTCSIDYCVADRGRRSRPRPIAHLSVHDVRREGVSFASYIWTVKDRIDLEIVKDQWDDCWKLLKASQVAAGITTDENASLSPVFLEMDESGEARRQVVEIILSILKYLCGISKDDARAQGIANSIWQSIRPGLVEGDLLPDIPGKDLFNHPLVQIYSWNILQLDHSPNGSSYNQLWFIERIMSDKGLWVGQYTHVMHPQFEDELGRAMTSEPTGTAIRSEEVRNALTSCSFVESMKSKDIHELLESAEACEALESDEARQFFRSEKVRKMLESQECSKLLQWDELHEHIRYEEAFKKAREDLKGLSSCGEGEDPSLLNYEDPDPKIRESAGKFEGNSGKKPGPLPETIMDRQAGLEMISSFFNSHIKSLEKSSFWDPAMSRNHNAWLASLSARIEKGTWGLPEAEANRVLKLFSVFDVQQPCTVATPFDSDIELLPRPDIRSLSMCWVVKKVQDEIVPQGENIAKGKRKSSMNDGIGVGESLGFEGMGRGTCLYQVVGKVQGLWEIMDLPDIMNVNNLMYTMKGAPGPDRSFLDQKRGVMITERHIVPGSCTLLRSLQFKP